jgi:glutaredoxin
MCALQVKGQQDYIKRIFDSKSIPYEEVDIAAPYYEKEKKYMQEEVRKTQSPAATTDDQTPQQPEPILPPQLFVDNAYRGVSILTCRLHAQGAVGSRTYFNIARSRLRTHSQFVINFGD